MSVADNKALILRFYEEVWNGGNVDVANEVFADDHVRHDPRPGVVPPGPAGQAKIASDFRAGFPDLRFRVEMVFGEGDFVVARWTATGTHTGPWAGIEPSGAEIEFSGANIFRFEGGKVAEIWNHRDDLGLLERIGAAIDSGTTEPPP